MKFFALEAITLSDNDSLEEIRSYVAENGADALAAFQGIIGMADGIAEKVGRKIIKKLEDKVRSADKTEIRKAVDKLEFDKLCLIYSLIKCAKAHKEMIQE